MKYEITITEIKEETFTRKGEHTVVDEIPWTTELLKEETVYGGLANFLAAMPVKKVYGYAPSFESTREVKTEILKQVVDGLDLPKVIGAINNL